MIRDLIFHVNGTSKGRTARRDIAPRTHEQHIDIIWSVSIASGAHRGEITGGLQGVNCTRAGILSWTPRVYEFLVAIELTVIAKFKEILLRLR
jgi:hypothetical protein